MVIPRIYNGRGRTFFFVATEAYRQQDGSNTALSLPTALERAGNFSQSFNRNGSQQVIYDPLTTTAAGARTTFPGNIIPASQLSSIRWA